MANVFETAVDVLTDDLVVVIGYEGTQVIDHFGSSFLGIPIKYVHQREWLRLGHAVLQAEPHIIESFLLLNGDNVSAESVAPAVAAVDAKYINGVLADEPVSKAEARTMGVFELDDGRLASWRNLRTQRRHL